MKKAPCCAGRFLCCVFGFGQGYQGGCPTKYINDFSNISIITRNISTIISIYRRFDKGYRFIDKVRQNKFLIYPLNILYEKRSTSGKTKILTNSSENPLNHSEKPKNPPLLNFLTNPPIPKSSAPLSRILSHTRKNKSFPY